MESVNPSELSREATPNLLGDSIDESMTPERCDLDHWFRTSAQDMLSGLEHGHAPDLPIPDVMMTDGPLRSAIFDEFSFRAQSEEAAARAITYLIQSAPDLDAMDFYATQLIDEARHAYVFRWHLIELGVPRRQIARVVAELSGTKRETILRPLEALGRECGAAGDFFGCVIVLAVIAEGALAPAAEMSERKWRIFDPPAAQICRTANEDEIRHLSVGSSIVRAHLLQHPDEHDRLVALIKRGMEIWNTLPIADVVAHREELFQQGIERNGSILGDEELIPGRPLVDTSVDERLAIQFGWSSKMREERLAFMGIELS